MRTPKTKIIKLKASELRVHPTAQRKIVPSHAKHVHDTLNLDAIGVIHVVRYRTGGVLAYWIVDGQHRWWALMKHGFGDWELTCELHEDVKNDANASALFLALNKRANMAPFDLYVNEVQAENPVALGVKKIVEDRGFRIDRYTGDGIIPGVAALKAVYVREGDDALAAALDTAVGAWGHVSSGVEAQMIRGLGALFGTYDGQIDRPALVKKLAKFPGGAAGVLGQAKARYQSRERGLNMAGCVQLVVAGTYNRGRRSGKLEL